MTTPDTSQLDTFQQARAAVQTEAEKLSGRVRQLRAFYSTNAVPDRDRDFVRSLLRANDRSGLSLKQAEWVEKLLIRYAESKATVSEPVQIGPSMSGVVELLERAKDNGLKFPKLWLRFSDKSDLRITVCGENAKNPGHLKLTNGESYGSPENRYYGSISPAGRLEFGRDALNNIPLRSELMSLLTRLGTEPAKVAAEFGHLTGHCCFCSRALSDERSTSVGYGGTCAEKYGLPWG